MNYLSELQQNELSFLTFLSKKYSFFYHSNIFLRDIQYAIHSYFKLKNIDLRFSETENLAYNFANYMTENQKFTKINDSTWKVMIDISPQKAEEVDNIQE